MMRLLVVFLILGFGLVVLLFTNGGARNFGMDDDSFGEMIRLLPFALLLSVGILASRRSLGETVRQMALWLLIILALVTGYLYRGELRSVGERLLAGLVPGRAVVVTASDGGAEVVLQKSLGGHFVTSVDVDGVSVPMVVDTGASSVALSYEDALRIGIDPARLNFTRTILTANGRAMAAPARLRQVAIGPILRTDVEGLVVEDGKLDQSLLGMSFLSTLQSLQMQSDELRLRD
ncbi:TIGR02281 family clan AA aspartic protease [Ciceribacter ferrooxidans]|uniref:TIGR02281 family clan AA aspartic protease n=1 Tax=Ciceribacter ferrooxidans TaxID=2509717 RepID=A0A4Q2T2P7_9HYPH|nr:TIGR02281 family clan AA aspartic protease [Ciceribacter ferrooxidans]RYC12183.1 TIGR02281 family clan AA aspartic protease [Ciceribacter ferrooxidans]